MESNTDIKITIFKQIKIDEPEQINTRWKEKSSPAHNSAYISLRLTRIFIP